MRHTHNGNKHFRGNIKKHTHTEQQHMNDINNNSHHLGDVYTLGAKAVCFGINNNSSKKNRRFSANLLSQNMILPIRARHCYPMHVIRWYFKHVIDDFAKEFGRSVQHSVTKLPLRIQPESGKLERNKYALLSLLPPPPPSSSSSSSSELCTAQLFRQIALASI